MKISWTSLKISLAGAKLSHLVRKDDIWDHGSMTEQVKNIFYQVEKAKYKKESEPIRKYVTVKAYDQINQLIKSNEQKFLKNTVLTDISIIDVGAKTNKNSDRFTALLMGKRKKDQEILHAVPGLGVESFRERWFLIREGDWWLLDEIRK